MKPVFADPLTQRLADFVIGIGIDVTAGELPDDTFLPGVDIRFGGLVIDERRLAHPGDILHEAGHIAVSEPQSRKAERFEATDGEELATLAWSWAALTHLELDPAVVFHPGGYKGEAEWLLDTFASGGAIGVPLLQYYGLTLEPRQAAERGVAPFPNMLRWLR
ncbi:hypothetical protein AS593_21135 [Caulobacter vibrioides]|nr:hypothetical protein AS593_21135 [Caulobacter vibrioides]